MTIQVSDIKKDYIPIREAKAMSGLRIVLGAFAVPGPWHEACKGVYYVKGLDYTAVRSSNEDSSDALLGMANSQSELVEWTAQSSAPVVIWNDERPRSIWNDQLYLAERLNPEPPLIPADPEDRIRMFGLANDLLGEDGVAYCKRHFMTSVPLASLPDDSPNRAMFAHLGEKYGYSEAKLARASSSARRFISDGSSGVGRPARSVTSATPRALPSLPTTSWYKAFASSSCTMRGCLP